MQHLDLHTPILPRNSRRLATPHLLDQHALALAKGWSGAEVGHQGVDQMLTTLGVDASPEAIEKASNARAHVLTLARVLAAYERQTDRNNWRYSSACTRDYLTWIATQGYDLSEVEQRATATD